MIKSLHYWAINRKVVTAELRSMPRWFRDIISNDAEHVTPEFKSFDKFVKEETERLFNDESYPFNARETFQYSQFA